jgi:hypothetical protein
MVTYFNLAAPDSDRLRADHMEGAPDEKEIVRCRKGHLAVYRRISDLALQVKHDDVKQTMIWPWIAESCVVHERIVREFQDFKLTGYRVRPAQVRFRNGAVSRSYVELVVTGWGGVARPESGIRLLETCPECSWKRYSGLHDVEQFIDWNQWTGEDFFKVWPTPYTLITCRVAEALLHLDVKSFVLQDLQEIPAIVRESGFTVGRLSDRMPEDLALKYSERVDLN